MPDALRIEVHMSGGGKLMEFSSAAIPRKGDIVVLDRMRHLVEDVVWSCDESGFSLVRVFVQTYHGG